MATTAGGVSLNAPDPAAVMLEVGPLSLAGRSSALPVMFRFPGAKLQKKILNHQTFFEKNLRVSKRLHTFAGG